jgi:uncharacterized membrane protein YoaK (UPF0700 family)
VPAVIVARRTHLPDVRIPVVLILTLGTGAVDAVSYFSLDHVFTANMSGNIALLGVGLATSLSSVAGNMYALVGFVAGSAWAGRVVRRPAAGAASTAVLLLRLELALMAALVAARAAWDLEGHDAARYAVCLVLAGAMGLQTGLARHLGVTDVNTTVATMTLHGLAADSPLAGGDATRWRRRLGVVLGLFAGAAIGVGLDRLVVWGGLAFTTLTVLIALAMLQGRARSASVGLR